MAPISQLLRRVIKSQSHTSHSASSGSIGGSVISAIILIVLIIFTCVFIYEWRRAKRNRPNTTPPTPLPWGRIFKKAIFTALTFGLVALCCAECCGFDDSPVPEVNNNSGAVDMAGGFVPQPQMEVPQYQPNVNWEPLQSAAQDGVQG